MDYTHGISRLPLAPANSRGLNELVDQSNNKTQLQGKGDKKTASASGITRIPTPRSTHNDAPPSSTSSRIPIPSVSASAKAVAATKKCLVTFAEQERAEDEELAGFNAYFNPSFEMGGTQRNRPGTAESTCDQQPQVDETEYQGPPTELLTPEALQILRHINNKTPRADNGGVHDIMNAFLRTGPQNLSPEPSYDYCIQAPAPAAVLAPGIMNFTGAGGEGVYGAIRGYLRTGANILSPEPGVHDTVPVGVPAPNMAVMHGATKKSKLPRAAAPPDSPLPGLQPTPAPPTRSKVRFMEPASVCSNVVGKWRQDSGDEGIKTVVDEDEAAPEGKKLDQLYQHQAQLTAKEPLPAPIVLAPVTSDIAGQQPQSVAIQVPHNVEGNKDSEKMMRATRSSRLPSPVAFNLSAGDSPAVAAAEKQQHEKEETVPEKSDSFSFGMRPAASEQPTCEPVCNNNNADDGDDENNSMIPRVESGETVHQPNPFQKMMQHLHGNGRVQPGKASQQQQQQQAPAEQDSPQSPRECTPLHLLPEGVSPSEATPELGRGDFNQWLNHRSLNGMLDSPALSDLSKLWKAAAERSGALGQMDMLRSENDALRQELDDVRRMLHALGEEHNTAVVEAESGKRYAQAEASRAQEAAQQMKALAEQIQATFAACERENKVLAAELGASRIKLAQAEFQAQADKNREEQLVQSRTAAEAAEREACAAKDEAAKAVAELEIIRKQLAAAQSAGDATPLPKLKGRLQEMHHTLHTLHQDSPQGYTPEITKLLHDSKAQLGVVSELLQNELEDQNAELKAELQQARQTLAYLSPERTNRDCLTEKEAQETPEPAAPGDEAEGTVVVDFKDFQQAMGFESDLAALAAETEAAIPEPSPVNANDAIHTSDAPETSESGCSFVVEGVVVTNVPPSQVNKVKSMVRFFETLADEPASDEKKPPSMSQSSSSPLQQQQQELEAIESNFVASEQQQQQQQGLEPIEEQLAEPFSPALPQEAAAAHLQVSSHPVTSIPETPPSQLFSAAPAPSAISPTPSESAATMAPLLRVTSLEVTPLSMGALRGRTGEEIRQEVRTRLNRLKSDLQAAQSKLKDVDRDLAAFSTPRAHAAATTPMQSAAVGGRKAAPPQAILPIVKEEEKPKVQSYAVSVAATSAAAVYGGSTALINNNNIEEEEEGMKTVEQERTGVLRTMGTTTSSKRRLSVRFAPSVKGTDSEDEGQVEGRKPRHPLTPGISLSSAGGGGRSAAVSPQAVVGSTRKVQPQLTRNVEPVGLVDAQSVQRPNNHNNNQQQHQGSMADWSEVSRAGNNENIDIAVTPARAMVFDSDSDDDQPKTGRSSRFAMLPDYSVNRAGGLATPVGGLRTPLTRPTPRNRGTPMFSRATPGAAQSVFSSASSFSPGEPVALLAMRPIVGRVRRAPVASSTRRPSETEEKEFRRRAAALKIHVSPYFNRREGGQAAREGGVL